jgi:hypothetical protein
MSNNSGPAKQGVTYPQDYQLKTLVLLSPAGGSFDLKNVLVEFSYFEDIFSAFTSGRILVNDAQGFIEKLHLSGNEYVRLSFTKAGDTANTIDKLFRVYKISNRQLLENQTTEGYIINFCSDELFVSEQYRVSKSYKNKKISDIIDDITKNYLMIPSNKPVEIENTKGIYDFIVPNIKPFEAINWLSNYALPAKDNSGADMLFFESQDGYKFASLQTLFAQSPKKEYTYAPKNVDDKTESQEKSFYAVLTYEFINTYDTLEAVSTGVFANQLITFDPLLMRHEVINFNYNDYFNNSPTLNKHPVVNNTKNRFGHALYETPQAVVKLATTNKGQKDVGYLAKKPGSASKDIFIENYVPNRTSQLMIANYNKLKLSIDGDPSVSVGRVIKFNLLSMDPSNNAKTYEKFYSGNYLVSEVKHTVNLGGYKTVLEIIKDSVANEYASPDDGSSLWQNTVKGKI